MNNLPYEYYIDIVTKRYFDGVDRHNLDQVLDCFHSDAVLTEVTSMTVHEGRDEGIATMFKGLFEGFTHIWHGNFNVAQSWYFKFSFIWRMNCDCVPSRISN